MEASREDNLLEADEQGRNAKPEVLVSDLCTAAEMAARIEESEYQLSSVSGWRSMWSEAVVAYSLYEVGKDNHFKADQLCKGLVRSHFFFEAAVEP